MKPRLKRDLYAYALGSMIYADIIMVGYIVMFAVFGNWGAG